MEENGSKGMAVAALIFGILGIICCCIGFPFAIIGLILAIVVLTYHKAGKGLAIAGLITSIITLIISVYVGISLVPFVPYKDGFVDLANQADTYIEDYEEDGSLPPVLDDLINDGKITEEQADTMMQSFAQSYKQSSGR